MLSFLAEDARPGGSHSFPRDGLPLVTDGTLSLTTTQDRHRDTGHRCLIWASLSLPRITGKATGCLLQESRGWGPQASGFQVSPICVQASEGDLGACHQSCLRWVSSWSPESRGCVWGGRPRWRTECWAETGQAGPFSSNSTLCNLGPCTIEAPVSSSVRWGERTRRSLRCFDLGVASDGCKEQE